MTPRDEVRIMEILSRAGCGATLSVVEGVEVLAREVARLEAIVYPQQPPSDYERLLGSLDEERNDRLGMLRDVCLETGREAEAKGFGWLYFMHRWPLRRNGLWMWFNLAREDMGDSYLPAKLYEIVTRGGVVKGWLTCGAALLAVVKAIAEGHWQPSMEAQTPPQQDSPPTGPPEEMIHHHVTGNQYGLTDVRVFRSGQTPPQQDPPPATADEAMSLRDSSDPTWNALAEQGAVTMDQARLFRRGQIPGIDLQ